MTRRKVSGAGDRLPQLDGGPAGPRPRLAGLARVAATALLCVVALALPCARAADSTAAPTNADRSRSPASSSSGSNPTLLWSDRFGSCAEDVASGVAIDRHGRVIVVGGTGGALAGDWAGAADAFLRTYDAAGTVAWQAQFGTEAWDEARAVAVDADGRVTVVGGTEGQLAGPNAGRGDAFVRAYGPRGDLVWEEQFGTDGWDEAWAVAVASDGDVVVAGSTAGPLAGPPAGWSDVFVRRYDAARRVAWQDQFGGVADAMAAGVTVDHRGRVVVSGRIERRADAPTAAWDAFVRVYSSDGRLLWHDQFGADGWNAIWGVATDQRGRVAVAGSTSGSLAGPRVGPFDAFVRVYAPEGDVVWEDQFGRGGWAEARGVAVTPAAELVVVGRWRAPADDADLDGWRAFVRGYDAYGRLLWEDGLDEGDASALGVAADAHGRAAVVGASASDAPGPCSVWLDAFVRVYDVSTRLGGAGPDAEQLAASPRPSGIEGPRSNGGASAR
jgi:hypothetical protein